MGRNMEADLPRDEDAALKSHLDGGRGGFGKTDI
jgi:hypothetical protein